MRARAPGGARPVLPLQGGWRAARFSGTCWASCFQQRASTVGALIRARQALCKVVTSGARKMWPREWNKLYSYRGKVPLIFHNPVWKAPATNAVSYQDFKKSLQAAQVLEEHPEPIFSCTQPMKNNTNALCPGRLNRPQLAQFVWRHFCEPNLLNTFFSFVISQQILPSLLF